PHLRHPRRRVATGDALPWVAPGGLLVPLPPRRVGPVRPREAREGATRHGGPSTGGTPLPRGGNAHRGPNQAGWNPSGDPGTTIAIGNAWSGYSLVPGALTSPREAVISTTVARGQARPGSNPGRVTQAAPPRNTERRATMTDTPDAMKHAIDALISEAPVALPEPIDARLPVRVVARHPTDRTQVLVEYTFPTPEGSHPWPTAT